MIESLRRYILSQSQLEEYITLDQAFNNNELIRAERDVDKVVAEFYERANAKSINYTTQVFDATITPTTATITNMTPINDGFFNYSTLEILSGENKGKRIAIATQASNVLTFFDSQAGLSGSLKCKLYQTGKFPRYADTITNNGVYYKTIPEFVKECVALQYDYRIKEGKNLLQERVQSGYSVNKDSYSENFDTNIKKTIRDRIHPEALDILDQYGLTLQTI